MQPALPTSKLRAVRPDRAVISATSLIDQMMIEAESLLRYNWTDVAIHDKKKIASAPVHQAFLWIVRTEEQATTLLPLSAKISDKELCDNENGESLCPLHAFLLRCQAMFINFRQRYRVSANNCYIVIKGPKSSGTIEPIEFEHVVDLISAGQLRWTNKGLAHTA